MLQRVFVDGFNWIRREDEPSWMPICLLTGEADGIGATQASIMGCQSFSGNTTPDSPRL